MESEDGEEVLEVEEKRRGIKIDLGERAVKEVRNCTKIA